LLFKRALIRQIWRSERKTDRRGNLDLRTTGNEKKRGDGGGGLNLWEDKLPKKCQHSPSRTAKKKKQEAVRRVEEKRSKKWHREWYWKERASNPRGKAT